MKKLSIVLSVLLVFGLESCNNWLDLKPESEIVLEDFWQTESQATSVLAAGYRGLTTDACMERMIVWGELRSDNVIAGKDTRDAMLKVLNVNITPTNPYADWSSFYSVINYCNTFLNYAPSVVTKDQNFTATKLHTMEAEALTLRALSYFYLVRAFNEVPLILNPSISDAQNYKVPKSTERVILDQIIKDLLQAQTYAKSSYGTEAFDKGRVTLNAVNSLLADVYLWDQQYVNCIAMCDRVLSDKTLKLVEGDKVLTNVFCTGNSTESIFELQFDDNVQVNNAVRNYYGYGVGSNGLVLGSLSFPVYLEMGQYSPFNYSMSGGVESDKDVRYTDFIMQYGSNQTIYNIFKYVGIKRFLTSIGTNNYFPLRSTTPNWIVYRLSDVMLMKAEALTQLDGKSNLIDALALVNTTYTRSNPTSTPLDSTVYNSKGVMAQLVLRERQREFLFEGKRWFDLMRLARRTNSPTSILGFVGPKLTGTQYSRMSIMESLYMPVPQSDIDINPDLIQNPFYDDSKTQTSN